MNNIEHIKQKVNNLPHLPGCYIMKNISGEIIYVGKAKNLKNRVSSYFVNTYKMPKVAELVSNIYDFDYIIVNSEADALSLEVNLIKKHKPFYNTMLKDDKHYAFIKINLKTPYPKLEVVRRIKKGDKSKYFGPYFAGVKVHDLLKIINNTFMLRDCNRKIDENKPYSRECLNYFIGICNAPCTNRISQSEYAKNVIAAINFLNGDHATAKNMLTKKMQDAANTESFERAIELRDYLKIIDNLNAKVVTNLNNFADIDVIGYATDSYNSVVSVLVIRGGKMIGANNYMLIDAEEAPNLVIENFLVKYYPDNSTVPAEIICQHGISDVVMQEINKHADKKCVVITPQKGTKHKLLTMANTNASEYLQKNLEKSKLKWLKTEGAIASLKKDLNLKEQPRRIEAYDISNMQGTHIVASMVVFEDGIKKASHYRKFKIQTVSGHNDDFASMKEVITRRFNNLTSEDESFKSMPNLVLIDGGKGQLGIACDVLNSLNINCDIISLAEEQDEIFTPFSSASIYLNRDNRGLQLLQQIRDEAHRFAITFHRSLRQKSNLQSQLTQIDGIGTQTAKLLQKHFGGISKIKTATLAELMLVKGVSKRQANNIYNHFN